MPLTPGDASDPSWSLHATPIVVLEPLPKPMTVAVSDWDSVPLLIVFVPCPGSAAAADYITAVPLGQTAHSRPVESLSIETVQAPPRNAGAAVLAVPAMPFGAFPKIEV